MSKMKELFIEDMNKRIASGEIDAKDLKEHYEEVEIPDTCNDEQIKAIEDIVKTLNISKAEGKGYILLPTSIGFNLFEIDEERLKKYLQAEKLYQNL